MSHMHHVKETTIKSVSTNHSAEWEAAMDALPKGRDKRGKVMFSEDDRRRLATLAVLVDKGVYRSDREVAPSEVEHA